MLCVMEDWMRIKLLSLFCGAVLGLSFSAAADVNGDMNNFFNKLGFASNTSQPQVWQGQAAGYASGGSLYARTQVKTIQLVSMTLPDINAGCGGIDAYLGSFSYINSEQLQRFSKQIMSNAAGYFFDLALQTTVPEIKTAKDFLQKMATDTNSMNLSSCQAAQGIVGGKFHRYPGRSTKGLPRPLPVKAISSRTGPPRARVVRWAARWTASRIRPAIKTKNV